MSQTEKSFSEFYPLSAYAEVSAQIVGLRMQQDLIHDYAHLVRVTRMGIKLAHDYPHADLDVIIPACLLHDLVNVPKTSWELRKGASRKSSEAAIRMLAERIQPKSATHFAEIAHAIDAHSFSANIRPDTIEAEIVQDADRLDSIGLIGVARCILYSGKLDRTLAHPSDPAGVDRDYDDYEYCLDHFHTKLNTLIGKMNTPVAIEIGNDRHRRMLDFQQNIVRELQGLA